MPTLDRRTSRLLDLSSYGALVVMGALGTFGLPDNGRRVVAVALCLVVGAMTALGPRARSTAARVAMFSTQTTMIAGLVLLGSEDYASFVFLFFVLSVHVPLVFGDHASIVWIGLFWIISSAASVAADADNAWFAVVFNLGVFPLCGLFGYTLRRMAQARSDGEEALARLREAQDQLQRLAVAQERNRLSRDLHDSVKQRVFAMIMQLGTAQALLDREPGREQSEPEAVRRAREAIDHAELLARQAGSELNLVIQELRPAALEDRGLADALRGYAQDWSRQNGIQARVTVSGDLPDLRAQPDVEHALFRIAQEAMANVARHSRATSVRLELRAEERTVALSITDDGIGFDPDRAAGGVGLVSMRERAEALGGELVMDSAPGHGATITVRMGASR
ncbi:sensor histidine kinase [Nocardioides sp. NPDC057772]|uniref:sensor histidine kinase n=1 Tax=Nocardioides sp. NPDC057772 TaxID=3346245 RepID=UPI00366B7AED